MKKSKNHTATRHYEPFLVLMFVTILGITGFQVYWLKENYVREKHSLEIKANVAFQETVRRLQVKKLKLGDVFFDSTRNHKMKIVVDEDVAEEGHNRGMGIPRKEFVATVNALRDKIRDTLKNLQLQSAVIVSRVKDSNLRRLDSSTHRGDKNYFHPGRERGQEIFQYLSGVDSLQDSLKLGEIDAAYAETIKQEGVSVPFHVIELPNVAEESEGDFSRVTVGFVHPNTYQLELGNTFPYLLKRITLPIVFSAFLVGLTILSFVVLYRSLLKQRRLAVLKNEFISNITHELKTPIATVGVAIEALRNFNAMEDTHRAREYLDISANELQRLGLLVDKVLKLSMFEKKEIELRLETLDLKEVVDEVLLSMRLQIEKAKAKISVSSEGDTALEGDRLHLLSIVFNLVDNALKYSKSDPVISIGLKGSSTDVSVRVSDNGIGIPAEYKNKIFEKFFRVPAGDTHNAKGYGLGLSYVAEVVKKHNGEISVDSTIGDGTTIYIRLPKGRS